MGKPKSPARNRIAFNVENAIIIRHETEEFGTNYYLFAPDRFGCINFDSYQRAVEEAKKSLGKIF